MKQTVILIALRALAALLDSLGSYVQGVIYRRENLED